jgi:hypothetical protein
MAENPNIKLWERVFELKPLASEEFVGPRRKPTHRISSAELDRMRRHPLASEEANNPPNAPTLYAIGWTFDGSWLVTIEPSHIPDVQSSI